MSADCSFADWVEALQLYCLLSCKLFPGMLSLAFYSLSVFEPQSNCMAVISMIAKLVLQTKVQGSAVRPCNSLDVREADACCVGRGCMGGSEERRLRMQAHVTEEIMEE